MDETTLLQFNVDVFEKSDQGDAKSRRIGGYASTESMDRQGEILVQKGLDFSEFLQYGWFNDDHDHTTQGILGYPISAEFHKSKGWYVEGYMVKGYPRADQVWELANALKKSDSSRRLGFSVEGRKVVRDPRNPGRILKARIMHVAITGVPVNPECTLDVLMKSFCAHPDATACSVFDDCCSKALSAGYATSPDTQVGGGALRTESHDGVKVCTCGGNCGKHAQEYLQEEEAIGKIMARGYTREQADLIWTRLKALTAK